jgi:hypothetical protein
MDNYRDHAKSTWGFGAQPRPQTDQKDQNDEKG